MPIPGTSVSASLRRMKEGEGIDHFYLFLEKKQELSTAMLRLTTWASPRSLPGPGPGQG